jgi:dolichol-phosphate mannosyltransferase
MILPLDPSMELSIVAPCYNEEGGLRELYRRVTNAARHAVGDRYEIVLVNDGSRDRTWDVIVALCAEDRHVVGVDLSRNFGHQLALTAGLDMVRGRRVLIIDSDLQDPPELLGPMLAEMDRGADVVYGQRVKRAGETWFKRSTADLFYRMLNRLTHVDVPRDTGDFRLMDRRVLEALQAMPEHHRFIRGMVAWLGFRQVSFPYDREARFAGVSKYPLLKMLSFALDAVTSFSIVPLRIASLAGVALGVLSLLGVVYALFSWLLLETVRGWTSVTILVTLLGSIQLLSLGILGEYVGRLYIEGKRRPNYVIAKVVGGPHILAGDGPAVMQQARTDLAGGP